MNRRSGLPRLSGGPPSTRLQPTGAVRPGLRPGLGAGGGQRTVDFGMRWLFARS
jgi:hypothetical protein